MTGVWNRFANVLIEIILSHQKHLKFNVEIFQTKTTKKSLVVRECRIANVQAELRNRVSVQLVELTVGLTIFYSLEI